MHDTTRSDDDAAFESEREELAEVENQAQRSDALDRDMQVEVFDGVRINQADPVTPVRLTPDDSFSFRCHKGVSCWNRCCHGADITLTPACILRLCKQLDMRPEQFLLEYTVPAEWEKAELPVAKLKMAGDDGRGACPFVTDDGCSVYENRPATCRYYPLGMVSAKMKGGDKMAFQFLVKEDHCQGHVESHEQTVAQFRDEQGVDDYDRVNAGWIDVLMKMVSWKTVGGPMGKSPTAQVKRMFFMVSTDVDAFRRFVLETRFLDTYEVDPEAVEIIKTDDVALLQLGFDWMRNVMFNEPTLVMKEDVLQAAIARAREEMGAA